jgi:hypothetical protein
LKKWWALALAGAILGPSEALAHDLGVSRTELAEAENGSIHARFTFAAREAAAAFDRDGHVNAEVKADGVACAPGAATTAPDGDGVLVDEDFACTRATSSIEATLYFVTEMGGTHEDIARITADATSHEELLRAPHRTILLELHRKKAEAPHRPWIAVAVVVAVALIVLGIRSRMGKNA